MIKKKQELQWVGSYILTFKGLDTKKPTKIKYKTCIFDKD